MLMTLVLTGAAFAYAQGNHGGGDRDLSDGERGAGSGVVHGFWWGLGVAPNSGLKLDAWL